jgi:hypothetical protein
MGGLVRVPAPDASPSTVKRGQGPTAAISTGIFLDNACSSDDTCAGHGGLR